MWIYKLEVLFMVVGTSTGLVMIIPIVAGYLVKHREKIATHWLVFREKERAMDKKDSVSAIKVMISFEEGNDIEFRDRKEEEWLHCKAGEVVLWNWDKFEYRLKETP